MRTSRFALLIGLALVATATCAQAALPRAAGKSRRDAQKPVIDPVVLQQALVDLTSPDEDARDAAVDRLIAAKAPEAIEPATRAMASTDANVRFGAVRVLGACGGPKAARAIADALRSDRDVRVRREASHALLDSAQPAIAIPALSKAALDDDEPRVRRAAIGDLGRSGNADAFDALVDLYADAVHTEDEATLRWTVEAMTLLCGARHADNVEAWRFAAVEFRERIESEAGDAETEPTADAEATTQTEPTSEPNEDPEPHAEDEPSVPPAPPADPDPTQHRDRW